MSVAVAPGLYVWTITLENGEVRTQLASTLDPLVSGVLPSPVVSAVRGAAFTTDGPPPTITSLNPATAAVGAAPFTLHVIGTNFRQGCQILWDGAPVVTTFVSATELTTPLNLASATPGSSSVAVRSLAGVESNAATFTVTAAE